MVDRYKRQKPSQTDQSTGKVFVMLMTNQVNECQQSQEEHTKRHKVSEVKLVLHKHHLHSERMKANHPVSRLPVAIIATKNIVS